MFALVSPNGKYHGHTPSADAARNLAIIKTEEGKNLRLLTEAEWARVVADRDNRASLCATLGQAL